MSDTKEPLGVFKAIPKIIKEVGAVKETKKVDQRLGGYTYRGIDDIRAALQPLFAKHDVFIYPVVENSKANTFESKNGGIMTKITIRVKYVCRHADGSMFEMVSEGEAMDSGDKATQKAMTQANKVMLEQLFTLAVEELASQDSPQSYQSYDQRSYSTQRPQARRTQKVPNKAKPKEITFPDGPYKGKTFKQVPQDKLMDYFFYCENVIKEKELETPHWFEPLRVYLDKAIQQGEDKKDG